VVKILLVSLLFSVNALAFSTNVSWSSSGNVTLLPAPSTGYCWRVNSLHYSIATNTTSRIDRHLRTAGGSRVWRGSASATGVCVENFGGDGLAFPAASAVQFEVSSGSHEGAIIATLDRVDAPERVGFLAWAFAMGFLSASAWGWLIRGPSLMTYQLGGRR